MLRDLLHGIRPGQKSTRHGLAAQRVRRSELGERLGQHPPLRAGRLAQLVHGLIGTQALFDKALATEKDLVAKPLGDVVHPTGKLDA